MTRVLLFGRLADAAGWRTRDFEPAPATLFDLRALLAGQSAELASALDAPGVQAAVDQMLVRGDLALEAGCEVAFLPAMSGG